MVIAFCMDAETNKMKMNDERMKNHQIGHRGRWLLRSSPDGWIDVKHFRCELMWSY